MTVGTKRWVVGWACCLAMCVGCAGEPPTGTVSGTVTLNGQPLKGGVISFLPPDGAPVAADIQPDGSFRAERVPVGENLVSIQPPPGDDAARHMAIKQMPGAAVPPPPPPPFPVKYLDVGTSDLRCPVQPGQNSYNAELKK